MSKLYIVKESKDFKRILDNNKYKASNYFKIFYLNNEYKYSRFGISVSKKLGNAVFRNKYKRKIRAIIDNSKKLYINNKDYIIILRKGAISKSFKELEIDYQSLINSIGKENSNEQKEQ